MKSRRRGMKREKKNERGKESSTVERKRKKEKKNKNRIMRNGRRKGKKEERKKKISRSVGKEQNKKETEAREAKGKRRESARGRVLIPHKCLVSLLFMYVWAERICLPARACFVFMLVIQPPSHDIMALVSRLRKGQTPASHITVFVVLQRVLQLVIVYKDVYKGRGI